MRKHKLLFALLVAYLVVFAAINFHRTPSGLRKKFSFRRIRPVKKLIFEDESKEHRLTPLITKTFSVKAPSEPDSPLS